MQIRSKKRDIFQIQTDKFRQCLLHRTKSVTKFKLKKAEKAKKPDFQPQKYEKYTLFRLPFWMFAKHIGQKVCCQFAFDK